MHEVQCEGYGGWQIGEGSGCGWDVSGEMHKNSIKIDIEEKKGVTVIKEKSLNLFRTKLYQMLIYWQ